MYESFKPFCWHQIYISNPEDTLLVSKYHLDIHIEPDQ